MLRTTPRVYTIDPGLSFADALAASLLERYKADPLSLSRIRLFLPNRRSGRALRDAFLRIGNGKPLLLPRMAAIGDVDEDALEITGNAEDALGLAPAIPDLERICLLSRLIMHGPAKRDGQWSPAGAMRLARELARLIDAAHIQRLSFDRLHDIVPEELSGHWQETLRFLEIITQAWPKILAERGVLDPAERRNRLLDGLSRHWQDSPPQDPVIAAGTTGSIPATARLLSVIARLPKGAVILPGFDRHMDGDSWEALDASHPQYVMKRVLEVIGCSRHEVKGWPLTKADSDRADRRKARIDLLHTALLPAQTVARWADFSKDSGAVLNIQRIDCTSQGEEAGIIVLMMRSALETPGKRAALVTPDRRLARQVRAELARWKIDVDDSAGIPAGQTQTGAFLRLLAAAATELGPVSLLALMKHPFTAAGGKRPAILSLARRLDGHVSALRGPKPQSGSEGIRRSARAAMEDAVLLDALDAFLEVLGPLENCLQAENVSIDAVLKVHLQVAEALCATEDMAGADVLWRREEGEALAQKLADAQLMVGSMPDIAGVQYAAFFDALIEGVDIRPRYGRHPRLAILGPIEARLHHADLMILGGLNEGVWPAAPAHDPWMSRKMRADFGLLSHDRRIGQAAHDFVQAAGAREVVLTRSDKVDGTPTVPSRWLSRLDVLAPELVDKSGYWQGVRRQLTKVDRLQAIEPPNEPPIEPPRPCPPVDARPNSLSVTQVESWMRDPYSLYARQILKLKPLDPLEDDPGAAAKGTIIHDALDAFMKKWDRGPDDEAAYRLLLDCGEIAFRPFANRPGVQAFWWPRFQHIARRFIEVEREREGRFETIATEVEGRLVIGSKRPFTLRARADRIDRVVETGALEIIDYKTGSPPTNRQIEAGFAPQLPLEGWMAREGAFDAIPAGDVQYLSFWQLKGARVPIEFKPVTDAPRHIDTAVVGLARLIERFNRAETPYLASPRPSFARYHEYDHLARVAEWTKLPDLDEREKEAAQPVSDQELCP